MMRLLHFAPWWLLHWMNRRYSLCWPSLVDAKLDGSGLNDMDSLSELRPSSSCWSGLPGQEYDYCGKYNTRDAFCRAAGGPWRQRVERG